MSYIAGPRTWFWRGLVAADAVKVVLTTSAVESTIFVAMNILVSPSVVVASLFLDNSAPT
jgi:hypothetical protein